jgi:predicted subunit of tRNA(5-methylaminomethyl-2-thiouridylate) methyltransferase
VTTTGSRPRVAVLFSGGKDSALAALLLEPFYEVTLVTCGFDLTDAPAHAREAAAAIGFDHEVLDLPREVAESAVDRLLADGYPNEAIQSVHEAALERVAADEWKAVADGTRRDDRTPAVPRSLARSLEDRHDVDHLAPLAGVGRRAIDSLVDGHLRVETGPSDGIEKGDYETALRALLRERAGPGAVAEVFPEHTQSRVVGRR